MVYEHLSPEEQRELLKGRLKQLEQEHLGHTLNVAEWEAALPDLDAPNRKAVQEQIDASKLATRTLDRKHALSKARLGEITEQVGGTAPATR